jgi:predicted alpha-1,6-mannanase (GH76 family)
MILGVKLMMILVSLCAAGNPAGTSNSPLSKGKTMQAVTAPFLKPETAPWDSAAEAAQDALIRHFWSPENHYFYQNNTGNHAFNYWWQAHALDVLLDGYERSRDKKYLALISDLHAGAAVKNGHTYYNEYYDDMEWMALACLRAYTVTREMKYKNTALLLWEDIKTGWSAEFGGGISWKKTQRSYKNTPANAPAAILAARLYQMDKKEADLEWARKIYAWEKQNLVDPQTGLVWDGFNRQGTKQIDKNWKFSYNQGVFIGAGLELFKATRQKEYLRDAVKTADYIVTNPDFFPDGIFKSEGSGDGGLFKGIFIRYLTQLILQGNLKKGLKTSYSQLLKTNGATLLQQGTLKPDFLFGPSPGKLPGATTDASVQLSGIMLLEALAKLSRPASPSPR